MLAGTSPFESDDSHFSPRVTHTLHPGGRLSRRHKVNGLPPCQRQAETEKLNLYRIWEMANCDSPLSCPGFRGRRAVPMTICPLSATTRTNTVRGDSSSCINHISTRYANPMAATGKSGLHFTRCRRGPLGRREEDDGKGQRRQWITR